MKKNRLLMFFMMLLLPVSVNALTGSVTISCNPNEAKPGSSVSCSLSGNASPNGILSFDSTFVLGDGLTLKLADGDEGSDYFTFKNSWNGDRSDIADGKLAAYREDLTNESFNIGTFIVKVNDNATAGSIKIEMKDIEFCYNDEADGCYNVDASSTVIKVIEDKPAEEPEVKPDLKSLTVTSGGILNKTFSKNDNSYILELDSSDTSKFSITAVPESDDYNVTAKNTDTGENVDLKKEITFKPQEDSKTMSITITVSSNGKNKDYVIVVNRPKPDKVGNAVLTSLTIGGVNVDLKSCKFDCKVVLTSGALESYEIIATLEDAKNFKFYDDSILSPNELSGENELEIKIIPKDSNSGYGSNTYVVRIVKESSGSSKPSSPSSQPTGGNNVPKNPGTGSASAIVMAIVLVLSFAASIYYYKRNMSEYN